MDIKIGVKGAPKEVELELAEDANREEIIKQLEAAMGDDEQVLWLTDKRGRTVGIHGKKIAYVELGSAEADRRVGFATA